MNLIPWLGATAIGLSLGLFGSGGSILTVPVLVFLFGQAEKTAITGSLFVVGTVALAGALRRWRTGHLDWPAVALFGLPGMAGAWLGARLAMGVPGTVQLGLFAVVMLLAAVSMLLRNAAAPPRRRAALLVVAGGTAVGVLTGLVGVGGGFLIVPGLTVLAGVGLREAIGSSLVIIVLNSAVGFWQSARGLALQGESLDWPVLLAVTALGAAGTLAGGLLGDRLRAPTLQRGFAVVLLGVGSYVLWHSLGT